MADYKFDGIGFTSLVAQSPAKAIRFTVPGEPVSKARPRMSRTGNVYTPKKTSEAELSIRAAYINTSISIYGSPLFFDGYVGVEVVFYLGTKRRKDGDNLLKTVLDALNPSKDGWPGAWHDDYLVNPSGPAVKVFTTPEKARTEIYLYAAEGPLVEVTS